jgi:hypothetical protein
MDLIVLVATVLVGIGGYKAALRKQDWWMFTYLPPIVLAVPFGLAIFFSSIASVINGSWGKTWEGSVRPFLIAAAICVFAFITGAVIGYIQRRRDAR